MMLAVVSVFTLKAQNQLFVEVEVPGTLEQTVFQISDSAKYSTESMKIVGPLNGIDMMFVRDMCGVKGLNTPTEGKVTSLDLSDVEIYSSDEVYMSFYGTSFTTQDDVFGAGFLYNCRNLQELSLPFSITEIDTLALASCRSLREIEIPFTVTSIGYGGFVGCDNIQSINVPNSVVNLEVGAFQQMLGLEEISLGNGIETIDNSLLMGDENLRVIHFGDGLQKVDPVVFYTLPALEEINVVDGNLQFCSVDGVLFTASMDTLVSYPRASLLTDYDVDPRVRHIGKFAFYNAAAINSVTMPESLEAIDSVAFMGCRSLSVVNLNPTLKRIAFGAFGANLGDEQALQELVIPASVEMIEPGAFLFNTIFGLQVDEANPYFAADEQGALYDKQMTKLLSVPAMAGEFAIPETVKQIGDYAYAGFCGSPVVYLPDYVEAVGDHVFAYAFGVEQITFGKGVSSIGNAVVEGCESLQKVYFFPTQIDDEKIAPLAFLDETGGVIEQCTLYVQPGTSEYYLFKKGFYAEEYESFLFADIQEMDDPDAVKEMVNSTDNLVEVYDVMGRKSPSVQPGLNIFRYKDGKAVKKIFKRD